MAVVDHLDTLPRGRTRRGRGVPAFAWVIAAIVLATIACWWAGLPEQPTRLPGDTLATVAQLAGLLASVLICLQLLLIARLPWLVRRIGLGAMVGWHRLVGGAVLILIVGHVLSAVVGELLLRRRTPWPELINTVFDDPELTEAVIGTALIVVAGMTSARIARARLRYEWWYVLHVCVYVGIFLSFAHQVNSGAHFIAVPAMRIGWIALYGATALLIVIGRLIGPTAGLLRQPVRVERVVQETSTVISLWLAGPGLWRLEVRAGQFFFVRFLAPEQLWTAHPYSVSRLPDRGRMRLTIGSSGDHSGAVHALRPGTRVLLQGPFGELGSPRSRDAPVLLVAGGSGIGPIAALAREFCRVGRDVVVVHRASSSAHLPLQDELSRLPLRLCPVVGRRAELGHDPLAAVPLGRLVPDAARREAFVCGSSGLVESAVAVLHGLGVPLDRIHREELELGS